MARVVVVEDDVDVGLSVVRMLAHLGHAAELVGGRAALRRALADRPDLVVTDVLMPDFDGFEVVKIVQAEAPRTRIVAMSGGGDWVDQQTCLMMIAQVAHVPTLSKPFVLEQLRRTVDACLEARTAEPV